MQYHKPNTISEINELMKTYNSSAHIIAGGTDLLVEARSHREYFQDHWIDISVIKDLNKIEEQDNEIIIGPMITHTQMVNDPLINKHAPILAEACRSIGSMQIRNRGTIGGNICNASPCADSVPALIALDAYLVIDSVAGEKILPISDFFLKPYKTILKSGEWLKEIRLGKINSNKKYAFLKLGRRNAVTIARMNFAVLMDITEDKVVNYAHLVPGSVFPVWRRVAEVEDFLKDKKVSRKLFEKAGKMAAESMIKYSGRRWSTPYKEPVVADLTERVLCMAANLDG